MSADSGDFRFGDNNFLFVDYLTTDFLIVLKILQMF